MEARCARNILRGHTKRKFPELGWKDDCAEHLRELRDNLKRQRARDASKEVARRLSTRFTPEMKARRAMRQRLQEQEANRILEQKQKASHARRETRKRQCRDRIISRTNFTHHRFTEQGKLGIQFKEDGSIHAIARGSQAYATDIRRSLILHSVRGRIVTQETWREILIGVAEQRPLLLTFKDRTWPWQLSLDAKYVDANGCSLRDSYQKVHGEHGTAKRRQHQST